MSTQHWLRFARYSAGAAATAASCVCEAPKAEAESPSSPYGQGKPQRPNRRWTLQRSQTLRKLDLASTKSRTLHSVYLIKEALGEGAFGAVHLATDRATGDVAAVKRIPKSMTDRETFMREVNALLRIQSLGGHPHICSLRESFDEGADYYLVLDFVGGGEMFDSLIRNGAYSELDASRLVRDTASALAFLHGIGVVHADLKPENLMLSTERETDAVVKLVDFGCAEVADIDGDYGSVSGRGAGLTSAYRPPESLVKGSQVDPRIDMWALGVILYIMLCGVHPFDLSGDAPDDVVERRIKKGDFPLRRSRITKHLSPSAIDLIEKLMHRNPRKRLTAAEMLEHPWVRGLSASKEVIAGSDERLSKYRVFKSRLQAKFFEDVVNWSDDAAEGEMRRKHSLIERSFRSLDGEEKGFLTASDLGDFDDNTDEGGSGGISMSDFENLLSENMVQKHFPSGRVIYREGDIGNAMYFIVSGKIMVSTESGSRATRKQGDFFGEGALLDPKKIRSATVTCKTPVHVMEVSREYFEKYLATSDDLILTLKEKDKIRKRNRAKAILSIQKTLEDVELRKGDRLFTSGDSSDYLFMVESGKVDVFIDDKLVFSSLPGNLCGEHAVLTGLSRNATAVCGADVCRAQKLSGDDFRKLADITPGLVESLQELRLRRDFKKAVVCRVNKEFPYDNPREAFDAVKGREGEKFLNKSDISNLMREMNPEYSDEDIVGLIKCIDLTKTGDLSFDEFKKVFIADIRTSASI